MTIRIKYRLLSFFTNNCFEGVLPTPLHAAAVNGNKSLLQRLLQEGD